MIDLVEVEDVSVHVGAPCECVSADRTGVGLGFPHDRDLDCRLGLHEVSNGDVTVHVRLPVEDFVAVRTDVFSEGAGYVYSRAECVGVVMVVVLPFFRMG